jgi:hypothetical protein
MVVVEEYGADVALEAGSDMGEISADGQPGSSSESFALIVLFPDQLSSRALPPISSQAR